MTVHTPYTLPLQTEGEHQIQRQDEGADAVAWIHHFTCPPGVDPFKLRDHLEKMGTLGRIFRVVRIERVTHTTVHPY